MAPSAPSVILDRFYERDREGIIETYTNPTLRAHLGGAVSREIASNRAGSLITIVARENWAIRERADGDFLGSVSISEHHDGEDLEASYVLLTHAQGRGIATEALRLALRHAFEALKLSRILAETQTANAKSISLLERVGMKRLKEVVRFNAVQSIFAITAEAFFESERQRIAASIIELCSSRSDSATICPSEVARALWPNDWRTRMNDVRDVGRSLAREGKIEITQRGVVRNPNNEIRGAIRYRLKRVL
jgi:[ribosomal protein S5]-alanine N-acetyltransferase